MSTFLNPLDFFPTFYNMQSVSSNAVAQAFNGFIKSYDVDYGTKTVSGYNYMDLGAILTDKIIIGHNLLYWSANNDTFNIEIYRRNNQNNVYLIAKNGFTVNVLRVRFYYID